MLVVIERVRGECVPEDFVLCADLFEAFGEVGITLVYFRVVLRHKQSLIVKEVVL